MNVIDSLLREAADEARENHGRVTVYTQMNLARAGYELSALEGDISSLNNTET